MSGDDLDRRARVLWYWIVLGAVVVLLVLVVVQAAASRGDGMATDPAGARASGLDRCCTSRPPLTPAACCEETP